MAECLRGATVCLAAALWAAPLVAEDAGAPSAAGQPAAPAPPSAAETKPAEPQIPGQAPEDAPPEMMGKPWEAPAAKPEVPSPTAPGNPPPAPPPQPGIPAEPPPGAKPAAPAKWPIAPDAKPDVHPGGYDAAPLPPGAPAPMFPPEMIGKPAGTAAPKPEGAQEPASCAKALAPLADGYKKAYDDLTQWLREVDARTAAAEAKVLKLQEAVKQNEAEITSLRLADDPASRERLRTLTGADDRAWRDLREARREKERLCAEFSKAAALKVREYSEDIQGRLRDVQSRLR